MAVLEPTPIRPAAPAVELADCNVVFIAWIITLPSGSVTPELVSACTVPVLDAVAFVASTPRRRPPAPPTEEAYVVGSLLLSCSWVAVTERLPAVMVAVVPV